MSVPAARDNIRRCYLLCPIEEGAAGDAWKTATHSRRNRHERSRTNCKTRCSIGSLMCTGRCPPSTEMRSPALTYECHGSVACTRETVSNCPPTRSGDCSTGWVLCDRGHSCCKNRNAESSLRPKQRAFQNRRRQGVLLRNISA